MKVAFTSRGETLQSPMDSRFGRAEQFLVFETETDACEVVSNQQSLNATQGAGIQAAETLARQGVKALVTGHCGPNAFHVLSAAGIMVYTTDAPTVAAALEAFRAGALKAMEGADVDGHWA